MPRRTKPHQTLPRSCPKCGVKFATFLQSIQHFCVQPSSLPPAEEPESGYAKVEKIIRADERAKIEKVIRWWIYSRLRPLGVGYDPGFSLLEAIEAEYKAAQEK